MSFSGEFVSVTINSKLILLGDGPERIKAEKLCDELNLNEKVFLPEKHVLREKVFELRIV